MKNPFQENPFHFNLPTKPEDFLGRRAIVERLADDLYDWEGESYGIIGGRRFGKSSILWALEDCLVKRLRGVGVNNLHIVPVYVSLKAVSDLSPNSSKDVFGFILHKICKITCGPKKTVPQLKGPLLELEFPEYIQVTPLPASLQDLEAYIEKVVTVAYSSRFGLVRFALLIDEVDELLNFSWTESLFGNLRSLVYDGDMKDFVRLVLAGSERYLDVDAQGSPLSNAITGMYLEPFTEDAARELASRAFGISPNVINEIIQQSGGHPFIIQHILHYLFETDISSATIESVHGEVRHFIHGRRPDLEGWWRAIGENGQHVYSILHQSADWLTLADVIQIANDPNLQADRGLRALCSHGLVIHDGTYQKYHINGQLFRSWADPRCQALNRKRVMEDKEMPKIKTLFLAANPKNTNQLAIDEEIRAITQKVRAAEHRDALVFQSAWAVRPDDLLQLLNQHRPHIVHFSGHGSSAGLSLAGDDGQYRLVTTRALQTLFRTLKDNIRLVLLNACYSREQAVALGETIDCVIGMKESISDNAATAFASSFYRAIGFGRSIQEAFEQGITSLLLEGISEEDIPDLLVKEGVDARKIVLIAPATPKPQVQKPSQISPAEESSMQKALTVFFSYASEDERLVKELEKQLAILKRQNRILGWLSRNIGAGEETDEEIVDHLNQARVILLLISSDFLSSERLWDREVALALQKHEAKEARVIPILLRPTDAWKQASFGKLQALPRNEKAVTSWSNRDEAFAEVARGIREAVEKLTSPNP